MWVSGEISAKTEKPDGTPCVALIERCRVTDLLFIKIYIDFSSKI